jgi:hypothetical protein
VDVAALTPSQGSQATAQSTVGALAGGGGDSSDDSDLPPEVRQLLNWLWSVVRRAMPGLGWSADRTRPTGGAAPPPPTAAPPPGSGTSAPEGKPPPGHDAAVLPADPGGVEAAAVDAVMAAPTDPDRDGVYRGQASPWAVALALAGGAVVTRRRRRRRRTRGAAE